MINVDTGEITILNDVLAPGMLLKDFKKTSVYKTAKCINEDLERHAFNVKNFSYKKYIFAANIYFRNNLLDWLSICISNHGLYEGWDDMTEEKCLQVKKMHDFLLLEITSHVEPWIYSWGAIFSNYDQRSGSSSILIRYKSPTDIKDNQSS